MRRRRWRTAVLWVGCTLCVLIAAPFLVSAWWHVWIVIPVGPTIGVRAGAFEYSYLRRSTGGWFYRNYGGLRHALSPPRPLVGVTLPLVYPFAAVAIPTLVVWCLGRKPVKLGHCRCGYDLTGNVSGVCPECGVEVQT